MQTNLAATAADISKSSRKPSRSGECTLPPTSPMATSALSLSTYTCKFAVINTTACDKYCRSIHHYIFTSL